MAQKTYKQIQQEADRLFGKGASDDKFAWRQSQQKAAGLAEEKRKRGGVAGGYDRNKQLVQTALPVLASMFIPGSAALIGGITGGLARGLDRPGKSGIGLDFKQAGMGALTGAALGTAGRYVGGKLNVPGAVPMPAAAAPALGNVANANVVNKPNILQGIKEYAPLIQAAATPAAEYLGSQADRAVEEERLRIEQQRIDEEQARRDRLAQLLMPMFQQQARRYGGQG